MLFAIRSCNITYRENEQRERGKNDKKKMRDQLQDWFPSACTALLPLGIFHLPHRPAGDSGS